MYKYIVVPRDKFTNDAITELLAQTCALTGNETIFSYGENEKMGYFVKHAFITRLKNHRDLRLRYELYEQRDENDIRKYSIPGKKDNKHLRAAKMKLAELSAEKQK